MNIKDKKRKTLNGYCPRFIHVADELIAFIALCLKSPSKERTFLDTYPTIYR